MPNVTWSDEALKDLRSLDRETAQRIGRAVARFAKTDTGDIKKLHGGDPPSWRLRVGDWRILFDRSGDDVTINVVSNRRDAYR